MVECGSEAALESLVFGCWLLELVADVFRDGYMDLGKVVRYLKEAIKLVVLQDSRSRWTTQMRWFFDFYREVRV